MLLLAPVWMQLAHLVAAQLVWLALVHFLSVALEEESAGTSAIRGSEPVELQVTEVGTLAILGLDGSESQEGS